MGTVAPRGAQAVNEGSARIARSFPPTGGVSRFSKREGASEKGVGVDDAPERREKLRVFGGLPGREMAVDTRIGHNLGGAMCSSQSQFNDAT